MSLKSSSSAVFCILDENSLLDAVQHTSGNIMTCHHPLGLKEPIQLKKRFLIS